MAKNQEIIHQLVKKANQVAVNQPVKFIGEESAVTAVASHLEKFWDLHNRELITQYMNQGGDELNTVARKAVARLL